MGDDDGDFKHEKTRLGIGSVLAATRRLELQAWHLREIVPTVR